MVEPLLANTPDGPNLVARTTGVLWRAAKYLAFR